MSVWGNTFDGGPFCREKIDDLRDVLDDHGRDSVSVHYLKGLLESTLPGDAWRSYRESGDVAFVIMGPKDLVGGTITVDKETGDTTYSFVLEAPRLRVGSR